MARQEPLQSLDSISFEVDGATATTSVRVYPAQAPRATLILAHGAGAPQTHPWMIAMARAIAARGVEVVTFNFLYKEQKRGAPDKKALLEATWLAAIAAVRARLGDSVKRPLLIGGKSMGGRIATQVAVDPSLRLRAVVLLGYPLHPPGKPEQLRTAHLPSVAASMLFFQGTRDPFGSPDELRPHLKGTCKGTRLIEIEGGDHSLATTKKSGVTLEQTMARVAGEIAQLE